MMLFSMTDSFTLSPLEMDPIESLRSVFFSRVRLGLRDSATPPFRESLKLSFFPEEKSMVVRDLFSSSFFSVVSQATYSWFSLKGLSPRECCFFRISVKVRTLFCLLGRRLEVSLLMFWSLTNMVNNW